MADLADDRGRIRLFRVVSGTLSVALVFAVAEVLVLWNTHHAETQASQLAMAVFANVGVVGAAALALLLAAWPLAWLVSLPAGRFRSEVRGGCIALGPALGAGWVTWWTRTFGLLRDAPEPAVSYSIAGGVGLVAGLLVWHIGLSYRPSLMNLTRVLAIVLWMVCATSAVYGIAKTARHVAAWSQPAFPSGSSAPGTSRPNLLVVVIDTLRTDRVGVYGDSPLTPNLDRLAASSYVYETAVSTAPWTLPAHASLLTGLYPEEHGVNWGHYKLDDDPTTLAELAQNAGYDTFAVCNNWLLNEKNGFAQGFDRFIETTRDPHVGKWKPALRCGVVGALAALFGLSRDAGFDQGSTLTNVLLARRLARQCDSPRPFFALVNYFEPHDPYRPPERFVTGLLDPGQRVAYRRLVQSEDRLAACACGLPGVYTSDEVRLMARLYDAEIAYQDEILGELIAMLERYELLDNTWVVVTSDHGELFGEWDMVYHTASSHFKLLHVPLIVRPPGGVAQTRLASPVQPVDVFVTLAEAGGFSIPSTVTRAYPLPTIPGAGVGRRVCVAQSHGASIAGLSMTQRQNLQLDITRWMRWSDSVYADGFLLERDSAGARRLYDVATDPRMESDLAREQSETVHALNKRFEEWSGRAATRVTSRR